MTDLTLHLTHEVDEEGGPAFTNVTAEIRLPQGDKTIGRIEATLVDRQRIAEKSY
jgi:hypothetical protein